MIFPVRDNTEIIYLHDVYSDFELRIQLIRRAKQSIDVITLSQSVDRIGITFLNAIQEAQKERSVKVRFLFDRIASVIDRDFINRSGKLLTNTDLEFSGNVIGIRVIDKWKKGLSWDDFFHEKILIIDAGTSNECMITGGRGYTIFSSVVTDAGYLIRPINPNFNYLGTDIVESFNQIWEQAKQISIPIEATKKRKNNSINAKKITHTFIQTDEQSIFVKEVIKLLTKPETNILKDYQFRPKTVQLVSSELIKYLMENKNKDAKKWNVKKNQTHNFFINQLSQFSGTIEVWLYGVGFTEELINAFSAFVNKGNKLKIYTNGKLSHQKYIPFGLPIYYTTENLVKLINQKQAGSGNIDIYFLDKKKAKEKNYPEFLHRKLIIMKGYLEDIIYTGTDNFTWSSGNKNDEWLLKIEDNRMSKYLEKQLSLELKYYDKIEFDEIKNFHAKRPLLYKILRKIIKNNY